VDHIHTSPGPRQDRHSSDPDWRPKNPLYQRESQQGERVEEDGNGLASYGLDTTVWISQDSTISNSNILALEALLQTKSEKDLPDRRSEGVELI